MADLASTYLPVDVGCLIGRAWLNSDSPRPVPITVRNGMVYDLSGYALTTSALLNLENLSSLISNVHDCPVVCGVEELPANSLSRASQAPRLLAPCDLQAVKAAGVTFAVSLLERIIEEQAEGNQARAQEVRRILVEEIGGDLSAIEPGSRAANQLKRELQARKLWSQYLEVGIGPDAEVFTKSQPMASVGLGAEIGIHPDSKWNNPEPEVVLAVNSLGEAVGAALGNDVNLRDFEGRSALLLGRAKDNNASSAIGPFIRLFNDEFTIDSVRRTTVYLRIEGDDGFVLEDESDMANISRDPLDLVAQTINANHQYPDGLVLYLGTMFAPTADRDSEGQGFTHKVGDQVYISAPELGCLLNTVNHSDKIPPWTFGISSLIHSLRINPSPSSEAP